MSASGHEILTLPVLPVRNTVLFPGLVLPIVVSQTSAIAAIDASLLNEHKGILVFSLRDSTKENPQRHDFFTVGSRAVIRKMSRKKPELDIMIQGIERVRLRRFLRFDPYPMAEVEVVPLPEEEAPHQIEALHRAILDIADRIQTLAQPDSMLRLRELLSRIADPVIQTYLLASMLSMDVDKEQALLEASTRVQTLRLMYGYLTYEIQVLELRQKISESASAELSRQQREFLLRQQLQAIQKELGDSGDGGENLHLRDRVRQAGLPELVRKEAERELARLERIPSASPEYQVALNYLEFMLDLPWNKSTPDCLDLRRARQVLDEDHYDLKEIKERIIEYLAVMKMNPRAKAPILCFVGPPGVGKTSLGESIARSLGRKFERTSLGGMHDESELRGHRRTYIGAMPGRILQAIRRAGTNNPLVMLDEIDKLGRDFRGDPGAALMEILDPSQNQAFRDNYLDLPFDLSHIFFIATANSLDNIPGPLLDRMEVLRLSGYTEEEKTEIARRYLVPRQMEQAGLTRHNIEIPPDTLVEIVRNYTHEAGVRELERHIARVVRKVTTKIAEGHAHAVKVAANHLTDLLGPKRFFLERARESLPPGTATGLAWTERGGEVLFVETILVPDERGMTLTGQLGEVMKESAHAARSWIRAHAERFGIPRPRFARHGVHVHIPAGAIPKDGPSAGVTLAAALASLYADTPIRSDTAMTGELTLGGNVLPVGGIREKVLAARRAGIRRIIIPKDNEREAAALPPDIRENLEFIPVGHIDEVVRAAMPALNLPTGVWKAGELPRLAG